jgi:hypothetical protein
LENNDLFSLLAVISSRIGDVQVALAPELLAAVLAALKASTKPNSGTLGQRLPQLLALRSLSRHSSALEDMIATAVKTFLPVAHHGRLSDDLVPEIPSVDVLAALAETRWNHHLEHPPEQLNVQTFLAQTSWTTLTARTVSDILYRLPSSHEAYLHWLGANGHASITTHDLTVSLCAYLDASIQQMHAVDHTESEILASQFLRLLSTNWPEPSDAVPIPTCLFLIIKRLASSSSDLLPVLQEHLQSVAHDHIGFEHLVLGRRLHRIFHHEADDIVTCLVDHSLQRVVRIFSSGSEMENDLKYNDELCKDDLLNVQKIQLIL